ncbi:hypothetical protein BVX99_01085 [bacterium F16]|nr:hypothetical protein BVX99_01085 [bacterium F16]
MKLLNLKFKNLNSFIGEWEIDFTDPNYHSTGIFAITGPTGSGKTTILDAITLALFRRTPRLGDITAKSNEIMSRHTGECRAEVEFETQHGRYRATFLHHRANRKPTGDLQGYTHELVDVATAKPLLEKSATASEIETYIGMDFSRFTRSIMLAQGSFDAFLRAKPDERSPILEQITGTGFYAEISQHVHLLKTTEDKKLTDLVQDSERIALLSPEDEADLRRTLAGKQKQQDELTTTLKQLSAQCDWLNTLSQLREKVSGSQTALTDHDARKQAFLPMRQQLERAENALLLSKQDAQLLSAREALTSLQAEKEACDISLPDLKKEQDEATAAYDAAQALVHTAQADKKNLMPVLKQVRSIDETIKNKRASVIQWQASVKGANREVKEYDEQILTVKKAIKAIDQEVADVETYLAEHPNDQLLLKNFSMIRRDFDQIKQLKNTLGQILDYLNKAQAKDASAKNDLEELTVVSSGITERKQTAENNVKTAKAEIVAILNGRDITELQSDYETLRTRTAALGGATELIRRSATAATERELALATIRNLEKTIEQESAELTRTAEQREHYNQHVETLIKAVSSGIGAQDLDALREQLVEDEACLLCGSTEHPYATGNPPAKNDSADALTKKRDELNALINIEKDVEIQHAHHKSELTQLTAKADELSAEITKNTAAWGEIFTVHQLDPASPDPLSVADDQLTTLTARRDALSTMLSQREEKESALKCAQDALEQILDEAGKLSGAEQDARETLGKASVDVDRFTRQRDETTASFDRLNEDCRHRVAPFGINDISIPTLDDTRLELTKRLKTWQDMLAQKQQLERRKQTNEGELQKFQALQTSVSRTLEEANGKLNEAEVELAGQQKKRSESLGELDVDAEEARIEHQLTEADNAMEASRTNRDSWVNKLKDTQTSIERINQKIAKASAELAKFETEFAAKLEERAFPSEAAYRAACLPDDERNALRTQADDLNETGTRLNAVLQEQMGILKIEEARSLTDRPLDDLQKEIAELETASGDVRTAIGRLMAQLEHNEVNRKNHAAVGKKIAAQRKECAGWSKLHVLIGSSDGKKYRNFAQGLTFDIVIAHANRQLRKMTDRYLLIKNEENPLELDVIDNYQGGEVRTTKNLSGGESFIVSLALALGLSNMSSKTVRVDTMFLDEGFGTLDEDALDTALEALAELHEDGKLIGVISHVPALKERISTQLQVITCAGGRSQLIGPGVR